MAAAERHRELIADFETDCPRLGKPQVMGIARLPAADQARLRGDKLQMRLVMGPLGFCEDELALVDPVWDRHRAPRARRRGRCGGDLRVGFFFRKNYEVDLQRRRHLGILGRQHLLTGDDEGDPAPSEANMWTNSTPVTPEPMIDRVPGMTLGG